MANFLQDLRAYLTNQGVGAIYRDTLPSQPDECVALFVYAATSDGDGSGTRQVQIQVRRSDPDDAGHVCWLISRLLDSGPEEALIELSTTRSVIARPTARPRKLTEDEQRRSIYYCEVALWGLDHE